MLRCCHLCGLLLLVRWNSVFPKMCGIWNIGHLWDVTWFLRYTNEYFNFNNLLNGLNPIRYNQEIAFILFPTAFPLALPDLRPDIGWYSRTVSCSYLENSSQMKIQIPIFPPFQILCPPPPDPWFLKGIVGKGSDILFCLPWFTNSNLQCCLWLSWSQGQEEEVWRKQEGWFA